MGILNEKDIFSPKWVTAEITDAKNEIHYVPIKQEIGDFFIAEIDKKFYVFTLRNARVLQYRKTLARSFRVIQYDTTHYSSVTSDIEALKLMLLKNGLPKMDRTLLNVLRVLGRREKEPKKGEKFEAQSIQELVALFIEHGGDQYRKQVKEIQEYLMELDIDHIVTPTRKLSEYLQDDLITTHPSFLGEAVPYFQRMDEEHKKISNTEIKGTRNLSKIMLIVMAIVVAVAVIFIGYSEGWFDSVTGFADNLGAIGDGFSGIPSPVAGIQTGGKNDYSDESIQARYTPEALQIAINNGEIQYKLLSSNMQNAVKEVQTPTVVGSP